MTTKYNYNHNAPFEIYLTNLGKYTEGQLVGEWLPMPTTNENIKACLNRIGINERYEEFFITDYDIYVDGLEGLGEYENIYELNELAQKIEDLSEYDYQVFSAALQSESFNTLEEINEIIENLDNYSLIEAFNDYDLGYYYIEEAGIYDLKKLGNLANYIDYERFGRDVRLEEGGDYTDNGYIVRYY